MSDVIVVLDNEGNHICKIPSEVPTLVSNYFEWFLVSFIEPMRETKIKDWVAGYKAYGRFSAHAALLGSVTMDVMLPEGIIIGRKGVR